jgi:hypothetical protein
MIEKRDWCDNNATIPKSDCQLQGFQQRKETLPETPLVGCEKNWVPLGFPFNQYGYGSIPIHTIFRGMNIHLPAILMFTRGTRF